MKKPAKACIQASMQGTLCGALLFAATSATAEDCKVSAMTLSTGLTHSRWQEFSASGKFLLEEKGTLIAKRLDSYAFCFGAEWHIDWVQAKGQRRYVGLTNKQEAATTTTDIQDQSVQVNALIPLNGDWAAGIGAERRNTYRNIRSTEQAAGYPEQFSQWTGLAGLRYRIPTSENTTLAASMWIGRTFKGQVRLDLPNADPALLSLGKGSVIEAKLTWSQKQSTAPGWFWASTISWRGTRTAAGPATALKRNGRPVGTALQPRTNTQSLGVDASIGYAF